MSQSMKMRAGIAVAFLLLVAIPVIAAAPLGDCNSIGCKFFLQKHVGPATAGGKPHIYSCKETDCKFFNQSHVGPSDWFGKDGCRPHIHTCKEIKCKLFNQRHVGPTVWFGKDGCAPHKF